MGSPTNRAAISYTAPFVTLEPVERSDLFLDRVFEHMVASDRFVFDRFLGPSAQLGWLQQQNSLGYGSLERFNSEGKAMFASIGLDSLRTTAVESLPLELWRDHWQGVMGKFISGVFGNAEEEHVGLTSVSFSAVRSSWERGNRDANIQWGLRPWRTTPYVYLLAHAGHLDDEPLITFEGRTGYKMLGSNKTEGRLTLQLPASFRVAGGASVDLARLGTRDRGAPHFGVSLERVTRGRGINPGAVFYVGFNSGMNAGDPNPHYESQIAAGFYKRW